jgi:hypothetical protein
MKTKIALMNTISLIVLFAFSFFIHGCSDSDAINNPAGGNNFTGADNMEMSSFVSQPESSSDITITSAKILLRSVKFYNHNSTDVDFKVGPLVMDLNLASSVNLFSGAKIPEGTYDKVKFEIHKVNGNQTPPDPEFMDNQGRYSVIVKGVYQGIPFIFRSKQSAHQVIGMDNNVMVGNAAGEKHNVTLQVDVNRWFRGHNGETLDPRDPRHDNDIDRNIRNSFRAFKDDNRDGRPD